jgi:hypothetical protein
LSIYLVITSFDLHKGQLDNWKKLSKEVDMSMSKADGFISRDSGIDENKKIFCITKWGSKEHREEFMNHLMAKDDWEETMNYFSSIADMGTEKRHEVELF